MEQRAEYTCKKCRGHGQIVPLKGHKKACPWQQCKCSRCLQVEVYRHQHAHDQDIQVRGPTSSSQGLRAEEVIGVANLIKKGEEDSTSDRTKSAELNRKLEARGIRNKELYSALNRSMEQYSAERPNTHPALHLRKAITEYQEQRDRSSGEGKGRKYSYTTTNMWDSYSSSPAVESLTANSSQAKEQDIRASCRDAEDAIEMLLALMRSSTKTPSPSHRVLPCRQAKLAELFPNPTDPDFYSFQTLISKQIFWWGDTRRGSNTIFEKKCSSLFECRQILEGEEERRLCQGIPRKNRPRMAAANGHLHPSMNWDADDLVEEYKKFKQKTELAFKSFLKDTEPEQQVSYILLWVGSQGLDLFNSWEFTDAGDAKKPDKILEKFETHLEPKTNHRIYRYKFQGIQQKPDEPIDDYVARLKNVAKKCKFKDDAETKDRLVDQLIWGCIHKKVQKTLVGKPDLTLKDAMDTARAFEATQKQMSSLSMQTGTSSSNRVDAVSKKTYQAGSKQKQPHMYKTYKQSTKSCRYCGNTHEFGDRAKCPAYGSNCNACGKPNHWGKMCRAKNRPQPTQNKPQQPRRYGKKKQRHVHLQREDQLSSESEGESLTIGTVYIHDMGNKEQKSQDEAYTSFQIRKKLGRKTTNIDLKLKIDTGAQSNVMPIQHYAKLCPEHMMKDGRVKSGILTPSDVILTAYGGARIPHLGKAQIEGKHKGRKVKCSFFITKAEGPIILGLKACQQLDIIRINHEVKTSQRIDSDVPIKDRPPIRNKEECIAMYPECFDNTVGCFDEEYHITVDPTVEPVVHPPRRVPLELREKLREQLNEMVEKGVISQVTQPTDWVNSIVVKEKPNGKLRVCLDPRDLNNALKRDHYPTPTLEEITPSLAGAKIFSKLDASNGYWNIKIDEESSLLTTFNTPFGRFKFNRLPFGLKVSQDVFQRKVDETYRGCKGAIGIADDIQVFGKTERDHDLHLHEAMEKTRQAGIKLNAAKCTIKESECTFFGMIYSADGVKPDPEKVEAITNMEEPRDKKELRSFLGLIQYMSSFIPRLADHTASIRELLKEDVEYDWCASHTRDFNKIKQLISEDITLQYYDREKPVTLQVDASMKGVGAALLQEGGPIAFASKALTPAESRYANIEREMLAVVYGCEKFKTYLYGRRFTIESDHKPLEQIDRKNLTKAPARLQRLLLRIQEYDYHLKYKPGNEMLVADALSRLSPSEKEEMAGLKVQIHHLVNVTTTKLEQIQEETSKDEELQTLAQTITRGWPEKRSEVQPLIREYWTIRDDISIENGVLLAGSRIIIPKSLQKEVLQTIHEGHMGEEKCKLRAKSAVYWIGMYKEIEKMVQTCRTCQKYQNSQQKEEMTPTETPSRPWKKVGADLFYLNQKWFLLVVDYYSKFRIVKTLKSLKASTVTQAFKGIFAEQGIPDEVICDNGTQFTSQEFRQAAEEYGFRITTSSPYYPKGHGFIERQVQTVKKTLTKSLETGEDPNLALLTLRTTPLRTDTKSPAELLNGRRYKTRLPTKVHPPADQEEVMGKLTAAQEKSKKQYDRQAQRLPELVRGQTVHIQEPIKKTWTPGQIVEKADTPKSYVVETESGKQMRRNRGATLVASVCRGDGLPRRDFAGGRLLPHIRSLRETVSPQQSLPAATVTSVLGFSGSAKGHKRQIGRHPAAVETVINVFASPKSIGQTPYATHRGKKRRRFLCFTPDKHGPRTPETPPQPTTPETPPQPSTPETPPQPSTPETPPQPSTPETPPQPSTPETPPQPTTPETPPQPTTPETPPQPTTPETPPQPSTPETPPQPTTSVKYVPGTRTPNLKPDNESAQMLNFNRDINSAKQAVEGAERASGGATYYIKGPRKTPVKKRITVCTLCGHCCDSRNKFCGECGNRMSNRRDSDASNICGREGRFAAEGVFATERRFRAPTERETFSPCPSMRW
ncbi:hypothetical protein Bbelb_344270 [Branchiostoma belcheri]|nr:hypothetical protein Bbelb_344270 [Branchiostoma belcheri]